ncbi:MAG: hypothetical protein WA945_07400, partial [Arcobacteraceae bacterium]
IKYLTYFVVLHFIGFIFFVLRNQIPDFFSIIIANMLFAVGTLFFYLTIKTIVNEKTIWHNRYYIPVFMFFIGFIIFTYFIYDTKTRIIIYYFYCAGSIFPSAWLLWKNDSKNFKLFDKTTAILLFIISFIFISIIIQSIFIKLQDYYFSNNNIFMIVSIVIADLLSLWTLLALKYRVEK